MSINLLQAAKDAAKAMDQKFGKDIVILDISSVSAIADYFVIAEAGNVNQVQAMVGGVEEALQKCGMTIRHMEGMQRLSDWVLMDFGDIIIHIFNAESRLFYDLERTWRDATQVEWE